MNEIESKLYKKIRRHLDDDQLKEVARHGADAGWSGFTYYKDTVRFYEKNKTDIFIMLDQEAEELGEKSLLTMVSNFKTASTVSTYDTFANLMAWYALEHIAYCVDRRDE